MHRLYLISSTLPKNYYVQNPATTNAILAEKGDTTLCISDVGKVPYSYAHQSSQRTVTQIDHDDRGSRKMNSCVTRHLRDIFLLVRESYREIFEETVSPLKWHSSILPESNEMHCINATFSKTFDWAS